MSIGKSNGYVTIPRSIIEIDSWYPTKRWVDKPNTVYVYFRLLIRANYGDGEFIDVKLHRGETCIALRKYAEDLGLTLSELRTAIKNLQEIGIIEVRSEKSRFIKSGNVTVVKLLYYDRTQ